MSACILPSKKYALADLVSRISSHGSTTRTTLFPTEIRTDCRREPSCQRRRAILGYKRNTYSETNSHSIKRRGRAAGAGYGRVLSTSKERNGCEWKFCIRRRSTNRNAAKKITISSAVGYAEGLKTLVIGDGKQFHNRQSPVWKEDVSILTTTLLLADFSSVCMLQNAKLKHVCTRKNNSMEEQNKTQAVPSSISIGRYSNGFSRSTDNNSQRE